LGSLVPIGLKLDTLAYLRVAPVPQRRPACRRDARRFCIHPDVVQYLADVSAAGDEGDDAHLPAIDRAYQREHLADAGDQHRPQIVRLALWQSWLGTPTVATPMAFTVTSTVAGTPTGSCCAVPGPAVWPAASATTGARSGEWGASTPK
jgi:hypothetical protein